MRKIAQNTCKFFCTTVACARLRQTLEIFFVNPPHGRRMRRICQKTIVGFFNLQKFFFTFSCLKPPHMSTHAPILRLLYDLTEMCQKKSQIFFAQYRRMRQRMR